MVQETKKISFVVYGRPQQRGSKQSMVRYAGGSPVMRNGRVATFTMDANKKSGSWMAEVRSMAAAAYSGELLAGPVTMECRFYFSRPKSHYGAKGVKQSAPEQHTQTPDVDKLLRAVADALTGVVWRDDRQAWAVVGRKFWTEFADRLEVEIHGN